MGREERRQRRERQSLGMTRRQYARHLLQISREQAKTWTAPNIHEKQSWHDRYMAGRNADPHEGERRRYLLSILISTLPSRIATYSQLISELDRQATGKPVEIIALCDNRARTTGEKRNSLLQSAQGQFSTFIDDDDSIAADYVDSILEAIVANPAVDAIGFGVQTIYGRRRPSTVHYDLANAPGFFMPWRVSMMRRHLFPSVSVAEDQDWAARMNQEARRFAKIDKVLYFYNRQTVSWGELPGGSLE